MSTFPWNIAIISVPLPTNINTSSCPFLIFISLHFFFFFLRQFYSFPYLSHDVFSSFLFFDSHFFFYPIIGTFHSLSTTTIPALSLGIIVVRNCTANSILLSLSFPIIIYLSYIDNFFFFFLFFIINSFFHLLLLLLSLHTTNLSKAYDKYLFNYLTLIL